MTSRVRTPSVLQFEATECGAASLAMILGYHKKFLPLETLRTSCGVSRDGSKASSILKAARSYGLIARGLKAEPADLATLKMPMIAFVDFCHFLVIEGIGSNKVWLNDPAGGRREISRDEFDERFTGVVLTFERGPDFKKSDQRPSLIASLYKRMHGAKTAVSFILLISLVLVLPGLIIPLFSRVFVDYVLVRSLSDWLWPLVLGMILTAGFRYVLQLLRDNQLTRTETALAVHGARMLLQRMLQLPIQYFGARYGGEIASRLSLSDKLANLLTGALAQAALNLIAVVFFLALMASFSGTIALIVLVLACVNVIVFFKTTQNLSDGHRKLAIDTGKLAGVELSGLRDIESLKASGAEETYFKRWAGLHSNVVSAEQAIGRNLISVYALGPFFAMVISGVVLILGGLQIMQGSMTIGTLVALQSLAASVTSPLIALSRLGTQWQEVRSYSERTDDIFRHQLSSHFEETADQSAARPANELRLPPKLLSLTDISFGYAPLESPLISNFSLDVPAGKQIALVGTSGAGKSTLGRLIAGLLEPNQGSIQIDGRSVISWNREREMADLAYVDQEVVLFQGSIRDNLTMWKDDFEEGDIVRAAKDAMIHDDVAARPGSYEAVVDEGGRNFSGGQRQRLEIARALTTNPSIIVLDEATSALDTITEARVMANIKDRGATMIIVAHRLSAIRDCDEIIVLEHGAVIERGTHDQLLAIDGTYAHLIET